MTQAQIFADLKRRRYEAEEEGWTTVEYARNLGISPSTARHQVRDGVENGTIKCVGRKSWTNEHGRTFWLPAYLFIDAPKIGTKASNNRAETGKAPVARSVPSRRDR